MSNLAEVVGWNAAIARDTHRTLQVAQGAIEQGVPKAWVRHVTNEIDFGRIDKLKASREVAMVFARMGEDTS